MMKSNTLQSLKATNLKLSFSISPLTKWVLTILILGVGIAFIAYSYTQEQSRNHQLQDQVDRSSATLVDNNLTMRDLEGQLAEANLSLAEMRALVPPSEQTMTIDEKLYALGTDAGVAVNSVSTSSLNDADESGYQSFRVTVTATGEVDDQLRFAGILGHWLPTAEVASASMNGEIITMVLTVYVQ
jgi:hypothetical protein